MKLTHYFSRTLITLFIVGAVCLVYSQTKEGSNSNRSENTIQLPEPDLSGKITVEKALRERRSVRDYSTEALSLAELSQLLWAAQGITKAIEEPPSYWRGEKWMGGLRTAPSAGGTYPIELYIAIGNVTNVPQGLYKYDPLIHAIEKILDGDQRKNISEAALNQGSIQKGAAVLAICANVKRTAFKYGERADMYVKIEVGAVGQNICLQSVALNLGTVFIGAFHDEKVKAALHLPVDEIPLGIMPVGKIGK